MKTNRTSVARIAMALACAASTWSLAPRLALAQGDEAGAQAAPQENAGVWSRHVVREADLDALPALLAPGAAQAQGARSEKSLTLDVSEESLRGRPEALRALRAWARSGGTVFLHTGAARLFGFETVEARPATDQLAGQMFGRARTALPLASHPFLAGPRPVRLAFYQMREGDHLVLSHKRGVPLLRVTDLPMLAQPGREESRPLFAAAAAPLGRGWAVFVPRAIEAHRADGAAFVRNVRAQAASLRAIPADLLRDTDESLGLSEDEAEEAQDEAAPQPQAPAAQAEGACAPHDFGCIAARLGQPPADAEEGAAGAAAAPPARQQQQDFLIVTRPEAEFLRQKCALAAQDSAAVPEARVALRLARAQRELQRDEPWHAANWLQAAEREAASLPERSPLRPALEAWSGLVAAGRAEDLTQGTPHLRSMSGIPAYRNPHATLNPKRWELLQQAAASWQSALSSRAGDEAKREDEVAGATADGQDSEAVGGDGWSAASGLRASWLRAWGKDALERAQVLAAEPILQYSQGSPGYDMVTRSLGDQMPNVSSPVLLVSPYQKGSNPWVSLWQGGSTGTNGWGDVVRATARMFTTAGLGPVLETASQSLGWNADQEVALIFPDSAQCFAYRRAVGLARQQMRLPPPSADSILWPLHLVHEFPEGSGQLLGDVAGNHMIMTSFFHPNPTGFNDTYIERRGKGMSISTRYGTATPSMAGWMHAQIMINALAEGGAPVPFWMREGLGAMGSAQAMLATGLTPAEIGSDTVQSARATVAEWVRGGGPLLAPREFDALATRPNMLKPADILEHAQAMRLMAWFYSRFGAGRVAETFQRLGSGQPIDAALTATTGLSEAQFFVAWKQAEATAR